MTEVIHYVTTVKTDPTVAAAGFLQVPGARRVTVLLDDTNSLTQVQQDALQHWFLNRTVEQVRIGTLPDLRAELQASRDSLVLHVTGGTKQQSAAVMAALPDAPVFVLDAHQAFPHWVNLRTGESRKTTSAGWLTATDLQQLQFQSGTPFRTQVVHSADQAPRAFQDVLRLLKPRDFEAGVLCITDQDETRSKSKADVRAAAVVFRRGQPFVVAPESLKPSLPSVPDSERPFKEASAVRQIIKKHVALTRTCAGGTGVPVFLKRPGEQLPDVTALRDRERVRVFCLPEVLSQQFPKAHWVTKLDAVMIPAPRQVPIPPHRELPQADRRLITLVGFQAMPSLATILSEEGPPRPVILACTAETLNVAEQVAAVTREYKIQTDIMQVQANDPSQIAALIERVDARTLDLEVNVTGGTQVMALAALLAAQRVNATVTYTAGQMTSALTPSTSPRGHQGLRRSLGNTLTLEQYFRALGYAATILLEVNPAALTADAERPLTRLMEAGRRAVNNKESTAVYDDLWAVMKDIQGALPDLFTVRSQSAWDEMRNVKNQDEQKRLGNAYEVVLLARLLLHILHTDQVAELWRFGWSVTLNRAVGGDGERNRHELDFVLLTPTTPIFVEAKFTLYTAMYTKSAHLKLLEIARRHGANHIRTAIISRQIPAQGHLAETELLRAIEAATQEGVHVATEMTRIQIDNALNDLKLSNARKDEARTTLHAVRMFPQDFPPLNARAATPRPNPATLQASPDAPTPASVT